MSRRITRRTAARLLLAGPAALALPSVVRPEAPARKTPTRPALTAAERRQADKSIAQLGSTAEKLRKVAVPMGTEPAFLFRPILPKK